VSKTTNLHSWRANAAFYLANLGTANEKRFRKNIAQSIFFQSDIVKTFEIINNFLNHAITIQLIWLTNSQFLWPNYMNLSLHVWWHGSNLVSEINIINLLYGFIFLMLHCASWAEILLILHLPGRYVIVESYVSVPWIYSSSPGTTNLWTILISENC